MFKATAPLGKRMTARLPLTTKMVKGGYYKGNRVGTLGTHMKDGTFQIDWSKVRTYVCPEDLAEFKLTPFVTKKMEPTRYRPMTAEEWLDNWKIVNKEEAEAAKGSVAP